MDVGEVGMKALMARPDITEVRHVTLFHCYRRARDGSMQKITVEIEDWGPDDAPDRYMATVTSEDGKRASGNAVDDVQGALSVVHWNDLDK